MHQNPIKYQRTNQRPCNPFCFCSLELIYIFTLSTLPERCCPSSSLPVCRPSSAILSPRASPQLRSTLFACVALALLCPLPLLCPSSSLPVRRPISSLISPREVAVAPAPLSPRGSRPSSLLLSNRASPPPLSSSPLSPRAPPPSFVVAAFAHGR